MPATRIVTRLQDADDYSGTPSNGQALIYNSSTGKYSPGAAGTTALAGLTTDVAISSPALGDILRRNSTQWWNAPAEIVYATDHGVINDGGVADQSTALAAAIAACGRGSSYQYASKILILPPWEIRADSALLFQDFDGLVVWGCGEATTIRSHATDAAIKVYSCGHCVFAYFRIRADVDMSYGVQQCSVTGGHVVTTHNTYDHVILEGVSGLFHTGWGLTGLVNTGQNNDFTHWKDCNALNVRDYGYYLDGFECQGNLFEQCFCNGLGATTSLGGVYTNGADFTWTGGAINACKWMYELHNSMEPVVITKVIGEGDAGFIDAHDATTKIKATGVRTSGEAWDTTNKWLIRAGNSGVDLEACSFCEGPAAALNIVKIEWQAGVYDGRMVGCTIQCTDPATCATSLFVGQPFYELRSNQITYPYPPSYPSVMLGEDFPLYTQAGDYPGPYVIYGHYRLYKTLNPSVDSTITGFTQDPGRPWLTGQIITLFINDNHTTIAPGGNILLNGSTSWHGTTGSTISFVYDGTNWREIGRATV